MDQACVPSLHGDHDTSLVLSVPDQACVPPLPGDHDANSVLNVPYQACVPPLHGDHGTSLLLNSLHSITAATILSHPPDQARVGGISSL